MNDDHEAESTATESTNGGSGLSNAHVTTAVNGQRDFPVGGQLISLLADS
jgi:hypothetical protein